MHKRNAAQNMDPKGEFRRNTHTFCSSCLDVVCNDTKIMTRILSLLIYWRKPCRRGSFDTSWPNARESFWVHVNPKETRHGVCAGRASKETRTWKIRFVLKVERLGV